MNPFSDTRRVRQLIYGGEILSEEDYDSMLEKIDNLPRDVQHGCRRPSLYLQLFEDMINTVYEHESHLLSQSEWDVFATLKCYCYNARYCLVRLVLRKPDKWHGLSSLAAYKEEVGEVGLIRAITDLCRPWYDVMNRTREEGTDAPASQSEVKGAVDLTSGGVKMSITQELGPSKASSSSRGSSTLSDSDFPILSESFQDHLREVQLDSFCYDESTMDITELLNLLSVKELKELVKATKSRPARSTKSEMIRALLANAASQSVLNFPVPLYQTKAMPRNQEQRLVQMVLKILGKCIRINEDFYQLVRRLHLICFRCTEQPTSLLLPALLTSFKKRTYPQYKYKRDKSIWPTREDLLAYEGALELEAHLEKVMTKLLEKGREPKTPALPGSSVMPATPIEQILRTPRTLFKTPTDPLVLGCVVEEAEEQAEDALIPEVIDLKEEEVSIRKAKKVKELLYEKIYPRWKELIAIKTREGSSNRKLSLERFEPGYIYTRILNHASRSLATLKEYDAEHEILQAMLGQRLYRRGSRAKWYERRAIIQMMYLCKPGGKKRDEDVLRQALDGVKEALLDEDTGIVWRPSLFRRLQRLEKILYIPEEERGQCEEELKQPQRVFVKAIRTMKRTNSTPMYTNGRGVNTKGDVVGGGLHAFFTPKKAEAKEDVPKEEEENTWGKAKTPSWKGKSLWIGRDNKEVHVEIRALEYYETLGFKGFHAETRILTTIFSLLFWDIIFADVPGAFETPYQTAPLDLADDTFYHARKDMIEARLEEICNNRAREILERHDEKHREKQTMCIGLRWDICGRADLVEIIECLGGRTLALTCRLFCEDYGGRSSGVPDLVVWNATQGICKFVEVKGPGDRPQENQKLWFDSLLRAGANVEVCHIIDINAPPKEKRRTPGTGRKRKVRPVQPDACNELDQSNDEGYRHANDNASSAGYTSAGADEGVPKKRRRKKRTHGEDVLPSSFSSTLEDFMTRGRLDRVNIPPTTDPVTDTPSKRRRGR